MSTEDVLKWAFHKGYRVNEDGQLVSFTGKVLKTHTSKMGHQETNIRVKGKLHHLFVHRLCAYQKFGDKVFTAECVRHLDGNPQNNRPENLEIGTLSDNSQDIPKEIRRRSAIIASRSTKRYTDIITLQEIRAYYKATKSYKL